MFFLYLLVSRIINCHPLSSTDDAEALSLVGILYHLQMTSEALSLVGCQNYGDQLGFSMMTVFPSLWALLVFGNCFSTLACGSYYSRIFLMCPVDFESLPPAETDCFFTGSVLL